MRRTPESCACKLVKHLAVDRMLSGKEKKKMVVINTSVAAIDTRKSGKKPRSSTAASAQ